MYHNFVASHIDANLCAGCKRAEKEHTCEICTKETLCDVHWGMLLCKACYENEQKLQAELKATEHLRIPEPDTTVQVAQDFFNAQVESIESWRKEIEADASISEKHFALAQRMEARYAHFKQVIQDANNALKEAQSGSRAIQTAFNELRKQLTAEQRERIKIQHVEYKPPEKAPKKPTAPKVKTYDKKAIREAAERSGIPEQLLTMVCMQRNVSPVEAIRMLKEQGYGANETIN